MPPAAQAELSRPHCIAVWVRQRAMRCGCLPHAQQPGQPWLLLGHLGDRSSKILPQKPSMLEVLSVAMSQHESSCVGPGVARRQHRALQVPLQLQAVCKLRRGRQLWQVLCSWCSPVTLDLPSLQLQAALWTPAMTRAAPPTAAL